MLPIVIFFLAHWWGSVLMQTFFLHRYASHGMFKLSKGWERFFYLTTYVLQGSSYLVPRGYAYLHRAHHAYSDTDQDPHTPHRYTNVFWMMWETKKQYSDLVNDRVQPEPRFAGYVPEWKALDRFGDSTFSRLAWGTGYTLFYLAFAPHPLFLLLLPAHYLMGPIHGAIVNWAGHKYGYRNFDTRDQSRNVLVWDFVTLGELFQNNHHRHGQSINFGARWFELDPAHVFARALSAVGIIDLENKLPIGVGAPVASPADAE
ncbi:MAG TPA: acyl-CoA desaturase [Polyangiales bacterium]|nr:acyl-CoA desaturase [Polyangiales bacterium]